MANERGFRGVVHGGVVTLNPDNALLSDGTEVLVTPISRLLEPLHPPGTSAAVIAAMESLPDVPSEWVDELERLIEEGVRPRRRPIPFADEASDGVEIASTEKP